MHTNLRSFLDLLTRENEIITIKAEVDPYLELAEVHRRVIEEGGPALLFERVNGSRYPVVTNMFGTERRIDIAGLLRRGLRFEPRGARLDAKSSQECGLRNRPVGCRSFALCP